MKVKMIPAVQNSNIKTDTYKVERVATMIGEPSCGIPTACIYGNKELVFRVNLRILTQVYTWPDTSIVFILVVGKFCSVQIHNGKTALC